MRLQPTTILNGVLSMEHIYAVLTAASYEDVRNVQKLPIFMPNNRHDAKKFRALEGVDDEARTISLAKWSAELKNDLVDGIDPVMGVVNNVNILKNLAPDLSVEAKTSEIPFPVDVKDKVHKALLLLSGNSNYLNAVTDRAQPLRNYLDLLGTGPDRSAPAVVDAMKAVRSDWNKYKKLLDHLDLKKQSTVLMEWLDEGSIAPDMFKLLTSDVKEEDLYNGKLLTAYATYVGIYNTKHPTERLSLLAALTVCFGDFRVAQMIETAKSVPASEGMAKLAKDLENRQIKYWMDACKTPDEVAQLLRIGSPLLESSEMAMIGRWLKFIQKLSKHEKGALLYPIKTLKSLYSHSSLDFDIRIIKFLTSESDLEEGSADLLQASLLRHWFNSLKTPDQLETLVASESLKSFNGEDHNCASLLKRYKKLYNKFASPSQNLFYSGLKTSSGLKDKKWYLSAFSEVKSIISRQNKNEPIEKLSLFAALTVRYGDREASTIIDNVMRIDETMQIAKVLEAEQIQSWIDTGKTLDEVSKLLDFNSRSLGYKWVKFCNKFSLRHPELTIDPFEILRKHFGDDELAMFVVMATSERLGNAKQYLDMLVWRWFEEIKTPEELEAQLNQNEKKKRFFVPLLKAYSDFYMNLGFSSTSKIATAREKINVLTSSIENTNLNDGRVLAAVEAYVRVYNEANPNKPLGLLAALTAQLGYKDASTVIEAAKAFPDLAKTAKQMETEQIQFWVESGKTPDQVFNLLNFETKSPGSVYKWVAFHDKFTLLDPKTAFDPMKPLRNIFSDDELALFVVEAMPIDLVNAKRLESLLFWRWFVEMKTPEELEAQLNQNEKKHLFVILLETYSEFYKNLGSLSTPKLGHSTGDITPDMLHVLTSTVAQLKLYDGSVLAAIDAYVRLYNKANSREPLTLLAALTARLGHRDASTVIEAAKAVPNLAKTAEQLETEQMQFWVDAGMTPNQVVELLDPKSQGSAIIYRYIKFLNVYSKRPLESLFDPLGPLRDHFSDIDLATFAIEEVKKEKGDAERLQSMLLRYWFNNMMPYEEVVKLFHSNGNTPPAFKNLLKTYENYQRWGGQPSKRRSITWKFKDKNIENGRAFSVYKAYIDKYNKENPLDQMSMIAVLTASCGDKEAAYIIEAATHNRKIQDLAENVQRMQTELWLKNKKAPFDVLGWIVSDQELYFRSQVLAWLRYVENFETANPSEATSLYSMLINHFKEEIVNGAIFATNDDPHWEKFAERLCKEMEVWWRDIKRHPDSILVSIAGNLKDANVVKNRNFQAYIKYLFEFSKYSNVKLYRIRESVVAELANWHTYEDLTNLLIEAKAKEETGVMLWKVQSGMAIDPVEILKLGMTQRELNLFDAWMGYISSIIDPSRSDYDGYNAITFMTSSFAHTIVFDQLRLAMKDEALEGNAIVLLHEIFDELAFDPDLLDAAGKVLKDVEHFDRTKTLVNMLANYREEHT